MAESNDKDVQAGDATDAANTNSAGKGFKAWLPLVLNIVLMPVLAYAMTAFVLLPKVNGVDKVHARSEGGGGEGHGETDGAEGGDGGKVTAALSEQVLVNVAGTMGTRYLLAKIVLVGSDPALEGMVKENDAQLRDVAASVLASKTIADIEKPGARNLVRTELVAAFNRVLGKDAVKELYLTDFAVQ